MAPPLIAAFSQLATVAGGLTTAPLAFFSLVPLFAAGLTFYRYQTVDPESHPQSVANVLPQYDFIISGGGSAGAVLASRLSEIGNWTILLLEAGGDETEITDVPALAAYLQLTEMDWQYQTTPPANRAYCQAMIGDRCNWPRGKVLGGSSVLNAMVYVRGNRNDYDSWERQGNPGWGYDNVLQYFLKSEDNRNPYLAATPYHSAGGYLTVQESPWHTKLALTFLKAGMELGYENRDINGAKQAGFMMTQGTIRRGTRCSTAKAFLRPVRLRRNLHIAMKSQVTRVLIDDNKRAYGVEFIRNNKRQIVKARKEVILSSGAIGSPQILMLSGVGPAQDLTDHKIKVVADLKVGHNLQDHVGLGGLTFVIDDAISLTRARFQTVATGFEYILNERGPLTTIGGIEGLAFVNTKYADKSIDWPDVQFHFAPSSVNSDGQQIKRITGIRDRVYNTVYKPLVNAETWSILPLLLRPKSTGWIRLKSKNPMHYPIIEPNYFAEKQDMLTLIEGIRIAMALSNTTAFAKHGSRPHKIAMPGCRDYKFDSDEYWDCSIRQFTFTIYHPAGTCKMGPESDPGAVVDPRLRVYGIKGLRVIDASIMPTIVSGNPNAPTIMIGEKGADLIKEDWLS